VTYNILIYIYYLNTYIIYVYCIGTLVLTGAARTQESSWKPISLIRGDSYGGACTARVQYGPCVCVCVAYYIRVINPQFGRTYMYVCLCAYIHSFDFHSKPDRASLISYIYIYVCVYKTNEERRERE